VPAQASDDVATGNNDYLNNTNGTCGHDYCGTRKGYGA
jgi:hypothetical protein